MFCEKVHHINVGPSGLKFFNRSSTRDESRKKNEEEEKERGDDDRRRKSVTFLIWTHSRPTAPPAAATPPPLKNTEARSRCSLVVLACCKPVVSVFVMTLKSAASACQLTSRKQNLR
jgi:hypothetical protein